MMSFDGDTRKVKSRSKTGCVDSAGAAKTASEEEAVVVDTKNAWWLIFLLLSLIVNTSHRHGDASPWLRDFRTAASENRNKDSECRCDNVLLFETLESRLSQSVHTIFQ